MGHESGVLSQGPKRLPSDIGLKGKKFASKLHDCGRIDLPAATELRTVLLLAITSCCCQLLHVTNGFMPRGLCHKPLQKMLFQFFKVNKSKKPLFFKRVQFLF